VYYKTALDIDDLFFPAKVNLAMLYNQEGKNTEAERLLREVVAENPELHETAYSLALLLAEMERYDEAIDLMRHVTESVPEASRVQYNLGLTLQHVGRDAEAEVALSEAVDLDPDNMDYLYALADHYIKRGRFEEALPLAERMAATHPDLRVGQSLKSFIEESLRTQNAPGAD
jgi:tetratricopeptide (TPR) repeat protein